jgi:DNA-binding CsgD family transcriptional regulator
VGRARYSSWDKISAERCRAYRAGARLRDDGLAYLRRLAAGKNRQQIAAVLDWSETQVRNGTCRIQKKLGAKTETHTLVTALQRGIVSPE